MADGFGRDPDLPPGCHCPGAWLRDAGAARRRRLRIPSAALSEVRDQRSQTISGLAFPVLRRRCSLAEFWYLMS